MWYNLWLPVYCSRAFAVYNISFLLLSLLDRIQQMDEVNDELLKKITSSKNHPPARNFKVERHSVPAAPLKFDSSPSEVTAWLNTKEFSKP